MDYPNFHESMEKLRQAGRLVSDMWKKPVSELFAQKSSDTH
jgi:hypothetical protein